MSYTLLKEGIIDNLEALGYQESAYTKFESMPATEYGNTFILNPISGENDENTSETLSSLVYDIQKWELQILFEKSAEDRNEKNDDIQNAREALIKRLDNPAYWESYARIQKFKTWKIEEHPNYYILTIELKVIDTVIY